MIHQRRNKETTLGNYQVIMVLFLIILKSCDDTCMITYGQITAMLETLSSGWLQQELNQGQCIADIKPTAFGSIPVQFLFGSTEVILQWIEGVKNHLYWCATSTK